jgi:hypothetical protein
VQRSALHYGLRCAGESNVNIVEYKELEKFGDLGDGCVFKYNGLFYIKIVMIVTMSAKYRAIRLSDGSPIAVADDIRVLAYDTARFVISKD